MRTRSALAVLFPFAFAACSAETITSPEAAGPDYPIQGEYSGEASGAQVIALGGGKFQIVGWMPGLPGTAETVERKVEVEAESAEGKVVFDSEGWKGEISNNTLTGSHKEGGEWTLKRVERESPTLGAKPPEGAVVLFDGTGTDAWQDGKLDANGHLMAGTKSKQSFGDVSMHLEFRTPFMPDARGQARGNSGVYLQDRYEVQVLDSFGLTGENNQCGAIYETSKPLVNMCYPPLAWQTYDIDFRAARFEGDKKVEDAVITVRHNGVLVQDAVKVPEATRSAGMEVSPEPGPIQLQNHGDPAVYRNIWVVEK